MGVHDRALVLLDVNFESGMVSHRPPSVPLIFRLENVLMFQRRQFRSIAVPVPSLFLRFPKPHLAGFSRFLPALFGGEYKERSGVCYKNVCHIDECYPLLHDKNEHRSPFPDGCKQRNSSPFRNGPEITCG